MSPRSRPRDSAQSLLGPENGAVWLVAIVGLSLSFAALLLIRQQLEAQKMLDFEWVAHNRIRAISHGLDSSLLSLTTLRDHIIASGGGSTEGSRAFADALLERVQGTRALMWAPLIVASEREAFEASAASDGKRFRISERSDDLEPVSAAPRAEYFPVALVTSGWSDDIKVGFDLGSIPHLAGVLSRARRLGRMTASGYVAYPVPGSGYGFVVVNPVPGAATTAQTANPPRESVSGFVVGFFDLGTLTNAAVSLLEPRGVDVLILDESAPAEERFLHFYASRLSPSQIGADDYDAWWKEHPEPRVAERVPIADRQLTIVSGRTPMFRSAEAFQEGPWMALISGLVFTVLLSFYLARIREHNRQHSAMERQLVEREELFRQMTETVDEAFWATSANGQELLYLGPVFGKILGVPDAARSPTPLEAAHPDDRQPLADALRQTGRDGTETAQLHRVLRADGIVRWVRTRGFAVRDRHQHIYRVVGFMEDITEQKLADDALRESEAQLQDLFQHSPDIIMTVDRHGRILLMNRSIPELPPERAIGHSCLALLPREFRKWSRKEISKVFRNGTIRQFQFSADDGTYWEGRIVPIRSDEGTVTAAMVVAGDVTEKRKLEAQSLHNARLASIGVLAAGVAHEINNPNNSIHFNASLVTRAWHDVAPILLEYFEENGDFAVGGLRFCEARESLPQLLSEITRSSDRIRRIVQNLKHMSRQEPGELTGTVNIEQVLEAVVMVLHNQIQRCTDAFTMKVAGGLPPVQGSSQQLEQVVLNLLLNALQALPERSRAVHLEAGFEADEGMLRISVRDQGCGIPERDLGRLSEPFFTTRTDSGGTGLGLSISRSIVERHGGDMSFESVLGEGTTVSVRIPVMRQT